MQLQDTGNPVLQAHSGIAATVSPCKPQARNHDRAGHSRMGKRNQITGTSSMLRLQRSLAEKNIFLSLRLQIWGETELRFCVDETRQGCSD